MSAGHVGAGGGGSGQRAPRVTMYTKWGCGYCMLAKRLFNEKGVEVEVISVTFKPHKFQEMMERSGGRMTAPQVFIGDVHVGGYQELVNLERTGKLDRLLAIAGTTSPATEAEEAQAQPGFSRPADR